MSSRDTRTANTISMIPKHAYLTLDFYISKAIHYLLELRRKRRSKLINAIATDALNSADDRYQQKYIPQRQPVKRSIQKDPVFFRFSTDVTYVPEALTHIQSPWDADPMSTHSKIAPLIYEWKRLEDVTTLPTKLPTEVSQIALDTQVEIAMHIETLISHYRNT